MVDVNVLIEEEALRAKVGRLQRALRAVVSKVKQVHDEPPGAKERCPNHVSTSQRRLCHAIKRGESALGTRKS